MATIYIPALLQALTDGQASVEVAGSTVGELIENLERLRPGIRARLLDGERLRSNLRVAVDGHISTLGLRQPVSTSSEVHFVAAIGGG